MSHGIWREGNCVRLLENGEEFFPAVFTAIGKARREVVLETFILFEDKVGLELQRVLLEAAGRGVQVDVMVDGFGSPDLSPEFVEALTAAGVRFRIFDAGSGIFGRRLKMLRRMHRKIVVVDASMAFIGGINFSADHLGDFGPEAKQDYAIAIQGPIVEDVQHFANAAIADADGIGRSWFRRRPKLPPAPKQPRFGNAQCLFAIRDNDEHSNGIERHYLAALHAAKERVLIVNAYFFPGYRLLREIRRAARRGVDVRVILQGEPDMAIVKVGAELLYDSLQHAGVKVFEYCKRPLHGKVALVDDEWATVGSSNLDPLSLSLNLEANVIIRDRSFNQFLYERLQQLMEESCKEIEFDATRGRGWWPSFRNAMVFHVLRHFPSWVARLPAHAPRLTAPDGGEAPEKPPLESLAQGEHWHARH
ncbi:MAG TPA: cardiolipin synthase ClsB [Rhodocyclaceae bacterium]|nr:cardiolipin synthase ClsB [Rhodocyclaceae bacterium]